MFCIIDIFPETSMSEEKRRFPFPRRRKKTHRQSELSRVKVDGFPPFHIFRVSRGNLLNEDSLQLFRAYKGKLIFPLGVVDEELKEYEFLPKKYNARRMRNLTQKRLDLLPAKTRLDNVLIRDRDFACADAVFDHIPKMGAVTVLTDNDCEFEDFRDAVMENYGAVIMRGKTFCNQGAYNMIIDTDGEILYYTPDKKNNGASEAIRPKKIELPIVLQDELPVNCDYEKVAAALFEICGFCLDNL